MPDIALRFDKDMLVVSAPVSAALARQGVDVDRDLELMTVLEPDSIQEAMRLESMAGAQCLVTTTAGITPARMAQVGMKDRAHDVARASLEVLRPLKPQHVLVEIGPCGLPLDASSKASLNENRDQYARAARLFKGEQFDAFYLNGFTTASDLLCALMGVRQVSDMPAFASVDVLADGTLAGHVGFAESVGMIAEALGWKVDKFEQQMKPIVTNVDRKSPYGFAKAGDVAGVNMTGQGYVDGAAKIDMIHPQQIEPELEGTHTGDYIVLKGSPAVSMAINPEVDGGVGTIAMIVNMIPHVINARPGLRTMLDLPVPRAIMGDFRDYIEK